LLPYQTETEQYWTDDFAITDEDLEFLYNIFLEEEKPLTTREIARRLVQQRIEQEGQRLRRLVERGEVFQPRNKYEVGQTLVFPHLNFRHGEVVGQRPGFNPEHGEFTVLKVQFAPNKVREFASELKTPHAANIEMSADTVLPAADADAILEQYGDDIVYQVEQRLQAEEDVVYFAGRWFLRSLLVDVGIANRNLAEAVLVVHELDDERKRDLFRRVREQSRSLVIGDIVAVPPERRVAPLTEGVDMPAAARDLAAWCDGEVVWEADDLAVVRATYG